MKAQKENQIDDKNGNKSKPLLCSGFLAPYLPFELQVKSIDIFENDPTFTMTIKEGGRRNATIDWILREHENFKPILKPLGDLTKDEKTCDEINEFLEPNGLEINNFLLLKNSLNAVAISWEEMQNVLNILYREHYDVFGLINKSLAVSIHDVV